MPNCIIGLLTNINEAKSPFHKAKNPYFFIKFTQALYIVVPFCACFVFKTQNGFVMIAEIHPANPELLLTLKND
jgi:hypothetical protein